MEEINALEYLSTLKRQLEELDGQEIRTTRVINTRELKDEIRKEIEEEFRSETSGRRSYGWGVK